MKARLDRTGSWQEAAAAAVERIAEAEIQQEGHSIRQAVAGGKVGLLQLGSSWLLVKGTAAER